MLHTNQTLTSRISMGLNLIAFLYQRAQMHQQKLAFQLFPYQRAPNYQQNLLFSFFHFKALMNKFDLAITRSRSSQGHHCIIVKELDHQMLQAKFQGNQPNGSKEENLLRFLPHLSMAATLVM